MKIFIVIVVLLIACYILMNKFESMKSKTMEELNAILSSPSKYMFYHNALLELRRRNVDIEKYKILFPPLLDGSDEKKRFRGWVCYQKIYPESSAKYSVSINGTKEEYSTAALGIRSEVENV